MLVIPSVNFFDEPSVRAIVPKLEILKQHGASMIHLDISDGEFTKASMNLKPDLFDAVLGGFAFELHLMVKDVARSLKEWSSSKNVRRLVLHPESDFDLADVREFCSARDAELAWSLKLDGDLRNFIDMTEVSGAKTAEFLAVLIGFSGGTFDPSVLERIKFLKTMHPDLGILVDGGVNDKTAGIMKENGASGVITGSYLWKSSDVGKAYDTLKGI